MEKVVVVVVTTHLEGLFGSGIRFDCENFNDPKFVIASSDRNVSSTLVNLTRCAVRGKLVIRVANRSLMSFANGLSSSAILSIFEEVWCILLLVFSEAAIVALMGGLGAEFEDVFDANSQGDVKWRGKFGPDCVTDCDCFCRPPEGVVDLSIDVLFVPIFANPATLSLANAVNDLPLLLAIRFEDDAECW